MQKIKATGIALAVFALILNPIVIGHLFTVGKKITQTSLVAMIIVAELALLSTGVYMYYRPKNYLRVIAVWAMCLILWLPADYIATKAIKPAVDSYRQQDRILDHVFIPNGSGTYTSVANEFTITYQINSIGLRNPEVSENKTKIRILMLGDSFTEGHGVNYTDSVSKKLNDYLGNNYEVINAGVASYSPAPEYLYLKTKGIELRPDIVILNFDNSDIQDDILYTDHAKYDNLGEIISVGDYAVPFAASFGNTYLLITRIFYSAGNPKYDREFHTRMDSCSEFEKEWNVSYGYLLKIKQYLDERKIPLYVTIYPYGHQVATNQWSEGRARKHFDSDKVYPFAIANCFENHTYATKFNVFDLLADFGDAAKDKKLYYNIDLHMNRDGYDVMAKGIYKKLVLGAQANNYDVAKEP